MPIKRTLQTWAVGLAVIGVALGFTAGIVSDMTHGFLEVGFRRGRHEIRLEGAPILFWGLGAVLMAFWAAIIAATAYALWDAPRHERRLDAFLARKNEIDRSIRRRLRRAPKA